MAYAGIAMGAIGVIISLSVVVYYLFAPLPPVTGTYTTNDQGMAFLEIYGDTIPVKFIDENSGLPVSGLSLGFALDSNRASGAILAVDPQKRYSMQLVILEPQEDTQDDGTNNVTGKFAESSAGDESDQTVESVFVSNAPANIINKIWLKQLKKTFVGSSDILSAVVLAAKALDQSGLPLGEYAEKLGKAEVRTVSQEEAALEATIKNRLKEKAFVIAAGSLRSREIDITSLKPTSVAIDIMQLVVDKIAISACGLPDEKVRIIDLGYAEFYQCQHMYISDYIPYSMIINAAGVDQYNLPLGNGSIELVSKGNLGLAFKEFLDTKGNAEIEVPEGDYFVRVTSPNFAPVSQVVSGTPSIGPPTTPPDFTLPALNLPKIEFDGGSMPSGTVGEPYGLSFCDPVVNNPNDLCGGITATENPRGGNPPYRFVLDSGVGFYPMGLNLHPNGLLDGTPSAEGTSNFRICAVDLSGNQACQNFTLTIEPPREEPPPIGNDYCSSNSDCSDFGARNCNGPQAALCDSSDNLCHCCNITSYGGTGNKCISCSTGCGGDPAQYCLQGACAYRHGGYITD